MLWSSRPHFASSVTRRAPEFDCDKASSVCCFCFYKLTSEVHQNVPRRLLQADALFTDCQEVRASGRAEQWWLQQTHRMIAARLQMPAPLPLQPTFALICLNWE